MNGFSPARIKTYITTSRIYVTRTTKLILERSHIVDKKVIGEAAARVVVGVGITLIALSFVKQGTKKVAIDLATILEEVTKGIKTE